MAAEPERAPSQIAGLLSVLGNVKEYSAAIVPLVSRFSPTFFGLLPIYRPLAQAASSYAVFLCLAIALHYIFYYRSRQVSDVTSRRQAFRFGFAILLGIITNGTAFFFDRVYPPATQGSELFANTSLMLLYLLTVAAVFRAILMLSLGGLNEIQEVSTKR